MVDRVYVFGLTTDRIRHTVSLLLGWFFCGFVVFGCEFGCFGGGGGLRSCAFFEKMCIFYRFVVGGGFA